MDFQWVIRMEKRTASDDVVLAVTQYSTGTGFLDHFGILSTPIEKEERLLIS